MGWARPEFLLLVAVVACICTPAVGAGGDEPKWWCDEESDGSEKCYLHEYSFVETCILIALVCMALVFEAVYHFFKEHVSTSYHYGQLQAGGGRRDFNSIYTAVGSSHSPDSTRHLHSEYAIPLWKHWFSRLCSEIMVLGYIAFLIFISREAGLFDALANAFPSHSSAIHMPPTSTDWLHMVEIVHMKLFMGMLIYFMLVSRIVSGSVKTMSAWEEMRMLRLAGADRSMATTTSSRSRLLGFEYTAVKRYGRWRSCFIADVLTWSRKRPSLHKDVLRILALDSLPRLSASSLRKALDDNFAFSAYLAYSVCSCTTDTVEIHSFTWFAVILVLLLFAILHRFASVILLDVVPVFIVVAFLILGMLWFLVRSFTARVDASGLTALTESRCLGAGNVAQVPTDTTMDDEEVQVMEEVEVSAPPTSSIVECSQEGPALSEAADPDEGTEGFHEKFSTEMYALRLLQVVLFVCAYACARTLGDPADWKSRPDQVVLVCCVFGIIFFLLGSMLPGLVPTFAALMAMPPYVDRQNADLFLAVLNEHKRPVDPSGSRKGDQKAIADMMHHKSTGGSMLRHRMTSASFDVMSSLQSSEHEVARFRPGEHKDRVPLGGSMAAQSMLPNVPVDYPTPSCSSTLGQGQQAADAEWQRRVADQLEEIHRRLLGGADVPTSEQTPVQADGGALPPGHVDAAGLAGETAASPLPPSTGGVPHPSLLAQIAVLRRELERLEGLVTGEELLAGCPAPSGGGEASDVAALLRAELDAGGDR